MASDRNESYYGRFTNKDINRTVAGKRRIDKENRPAQAESLSGSGNVWTDAAGAGGIGNDDEDGVKEIANERGGRS